ncbi:O-antigen ligase domain-containing protein [Altererythrobacter confluentis]|uniref:O-antigen ligase domain-containing protein n=1 Tax=Allopontixanthobacter confluentis TaxID=1849021 RepID=A0A6L7GE07_9SPHN|nr:O-antigen ligase domain-containing protein [Allopontixanthobacter confluentis]MXP14179.1 O-antigen ligase domain-containing protein [Allopontixanthobacter confluentis]
MAAPADHTQTPAERLTGRAIAATWLLWLVGGLYIAGPVIGWLLAALVFVELYLGRKSLALIPITVWIWLAAMAAMLVILWVGHSNFSLGTGQTIKSSIGWAKGWALIALFPLAGAVLDIRLSVIVRAVCRLGMWTLIILPLFLAAPSIGLPETLWVSPLRVVGGPGPEYFATILYTIEPGTGTPRWQFFAPWSPAAGMVAVIYLFIAAQEKSRSWRLVGIAGFLAIALLSQSRLALVAIAIVAPIVWAAARVDRGWLWWLGAAAVLVIGLFGFELVAFIEQLAADFSSARADSSRVRAALGRIALERWENEAFWFGHGVVENGPHLVEYMPIGSHHSWYGLLFVKGLLGALALAVPLFLTLGRLALTARAGAVQCTGFALILVLVLYSFGENLEILAYLFWPALLLIGKALAAPPSGDMATTQ